LSHSVALNRVLIVSPFPSTVGESDALVDGLLAFTFREREQADKY